MAPALLPLRHPNCEVCSSLVLCTCWKLGSWVNAGGCSLCPLPFCRSGLGCKACKLYAYLLSAGNCLAYVNGCAYCSGPNFADCTLRDVSTKFYNSWAVCSPCDSACAGCRGAASVICISARPASTPLRWCPEHYLQRLHPRQLRSPAWRAPAALD
jgi:hypothetical protein